MTEKRRREKIRYGLDVMRETRQEMEDDGDKNSREFENLNELIAQIEEFCSYYKL